MWAVFRLNKYIEVSGASALLDLSSRIELNYIDGMVGALPVFETRKAAEKYADGAAIHEISLE